MQIMFKHLGFPGHICQNSVQLAQSKQSVSSSAVVFGYLAMSITAENISWFFCAAGPVVQLTRIDADNGRYAC